MSKNKNIDIELEDIKLDNELNSRNSIDSVASDRSAPIGPSDNDDEIIDEIINNRNNIISEEEEEYEFEVSKKKINPNDIVEDYFSEKESLNSNENLIEKPKDDKEGDLEKSQEEQINNKIKEVVSENVEEVVEDSEKEKATSNNDFTDINKIEDGNNNDESKTIEVDGKKVVISNDFITVNTGELNITDDYFDNIENEEKEEKKEDVVNINEVTEETKEVTNDVDSNKVAPKEDVPFQDINNYPAVEELNENSQNSDINIVKSEQKKEENAIEQIDNTDEEKTNTEEKKESKQQKEFNDSQNSTVYEKEAENLLKAASAGYDYASNILATVTGVQPSKEQADLYKQSFENVKNLPEEIRQDYLNDTYKSMFKDQLSIAFRACQTRTNKGEPTVPIDGMISQVEQFMSAQMNYIKAGNPDLKGFDPPIMGGMHPSELKEMGLDAYNGIDVKKQNPQDKKKFLETVSNYQNKNLQDTSNKFNNFCNNLNKAEHLGFDGKKLQAYLANRWKDSSADSLDTQRANFNKQLSNMMKQSYQEMLNNSNFKTDLKVQLDNFDKFSRQVENLCKAKGWIEPNQKHQLFGGLNPETIKTMQQTTLQSKPKNTEEWSNNKIEEITGTKNYNKTQQQLIEAKNAEKKDKKKIKELEKSLKGKSNENKTKTQKSKVDAYVKDLLDKVPNADEKSIENKEVRNAINIARAFELKNASRTRGWKLLNPKLNKMYKNVVTNITSALEKKGYNKEIVDYLLHNPLNSKNDEIAQGHEKQEKNLEEIKKKNEELIKAKDNVNESTKIKEDGEPITVPEAKDIIDPNVEKSKFVNLQVEKKLEMTMGPDSKK